MSDLSRGLYQEPPPPPFAPIERRELTVDEQLDAALRYIAARYVDGVRERIVAAMDWPPP